MKLRFLVLTAAYPSPAEPGRAVAIENLNRALIEGSADDVSLTVVAPRVHRSDPLREVRSGIEVRRFLYPAGGKRLQEGPGPRLFTLICYVLSGLWEVLRVARRGDYDAVLCHWVLPGGPIAWLSSFILEKPVFLFAHGSDLNRYAAGSAGLRQVAGLALRKARGVFVVSEDLRDLVESYYPGVASRTEVVPMGTGGQFQPGDRQEERAGLDLGEGMAVLFAGDLSEAKGVRDLLEARKQVLEQGGDFRLFFAGSGPLEDEISGVEGCRLLGVLSQEDLASWYRAADLLVLPSHSEGTPLVVMEALSCGTPVLATRVGGVPALIEPGITGELVNPGQPGLLAGKLIDLLASPAVLDGMRKAVLEKKFDFSASSCGERISSRLAALLGGGEKAA
ncbi:MAG: glycosyltransferase [Planctomycetota bacterium]|nr:glycosyltransferase [Planctomycetota bacterium]